ncbi:ABC transporter permease [Rouxiella chamberiensis]|uniref:ABC transporter permease n=1 Tax=Rouxiella chamberiensis TaxID=1513468 RepID=A0ABY7HT30_9GAMM|nr:ABC transporter permease [Rouxiella chamberiensis]WAT02563.1 ABC transporter permease [Rouxiella chamberiensis]
MSSNPLLVRTHPPVSRRGGNPWLLPKTLIPAAFVLLLIVTVIAPQWFTPLKPDDMDMDAVLSAPTLRHLFGTDSLGRDVFSRVIYGSALSLSIGLGATLIACVGGMALGLLSALAPRALRRVLVRLLDILLAFPELLLALLVIAVLGRGPTNTLIAVGLAGIASYARLLRSQVLQVKLSGYVEHSVALGESSLRIIFRHILPNTLRPLLILATLGIGQSVLTASSLSFLGLGVVPPTAEWGALLADGRDYLDVAPWISLLPATVVALSVIALTLLGRRLQTILAKGA